ncbi:MAG: protein adenylyltransferase SelO, partial [Dolichospermum sp.]
MTLDETPNHTYSTNPLLTLNYEPALESLGDEYYDQVVAEEFPQHTLRWRNDQLLPRLGLHPKSVKDEDFISAFGKFEYRKPLLALRYHGYQFGQYNPQLGDGRGFLYGQVRGIDGELYDFGTKGSGRTPYSRGGDGMLTLKGGVREVLAAEALHRLGVGTSRCLSMIETGLQLWRGDEPSPTRSSVMIRMSKSHIRFGTFERLNYFQRPDLTQKLLDHVIEQYYPHLQAEDDKYALFYAELVQRVAKLVAQWMAAGFCHAVLNTDNMSITGESFDYGPYAFIPTYDLQFTAAYFDYYRRYCYSQQPGICKLNLELLQEPLKAIIPQNDLDISLSKFGEYY